MTKYVVDTSSLMEHLSEISFDEVIVPTLVLRELEKHKSNYRHPDKQKLARDVLHAIEKHAHLIEFDFHQYPSFQYLSSEYDPHFTDNRLLESLFHYQQAGRKVGLLTDDLSLRLQAKSFGFPVKTAQTPQTTTYQGTKEISIEDERIPFFYRMISESSSQHDNLFDLQIGEYFLLQDIPEHPDIEKNIGAWKWNGQTYQRISMNQKFRSLTFREVAPQNFRQAIAMDSLKNNPITAITGKAGTGKTFLAMAYIMQQIEILDRPVYIVTNNVPLRGTNTFGFKKGEIIEKILQSNLGNILRTKIGLDYTKRLIAKEKLNLAPLEDIRGSSFNAIVYITEAQNYTVDMLKTILERMEREGQLILDGDKRQIDLPIAQKKYGFNRMFEVFQGSGYLGHVELKGNIRGGISELADKM